MAASSDTNSAALKWFSRTASDPIMPPVSSQTITFALIIDATRSERRGLALYANCFAHGAGSVDVC